MSRLRRFKFQKCEKSPTDLVQPRRTYLFVF